MVLIPISLYQVWLLPYPVVGYSKGFRVDQVAAGAVNESDIDAVVATMLRTKFSLGLFEGYTPINIIEICLTPANQILTLTLTST